VSLRLLLARHGQTTWNHDGRLQGQVDVPLSGVGGQQAARLRLRLAPEQIDAVYASDLERSWRTAELAVAGRGVDVQRDRAWRELAFGEWEGLTYEQVIERDRDLAERRVVDPEHVAPPGGEDLAAVARRIDAALTAIGTRHDGQTVLIVTHGGPLRVLACRILEIPLDRSWRFSSANCGLSVVTWYDAGPILEVWNDASHLDGLHGRA
jgi:alpha-ribazole phosphatase